MATVITQTPERVQTGIAGLDDVLGGGFPANRVYLIQGEPGVGKTTLALQFLLEGVRRGEGALYVTLSETREEIAGVARSHGWSLEGAHIYEMANAAPDPGESDTEENTLYVTSEIELGARMHALMVTIDRMKPRRVVIDSCSELRLLAQTALRFRRQILALKRDLVPRECTVLLLENPAVRGGDVLLQSLVHGVVDMEQLSPLYGSERRRMRVLKLREVKFRGGYHDFTIVTGGLVVHPRLVAAEHVRELPPDQARSGVAELDALLGGGLDRGTSTLILGPAGSGKSALATRFAVTAAAERGEGTAFFAFEESTATLMARAEALGMSLRPHLDAGRISIQTVDPAQMAPGQLVDAVRHAVEIRKARLVVIDSLNGLLNAMPEEQFVLAQMHELLAYLGHRGAATILIMAQGGLLGAQMTNPIDVSYLADTIVLLRFFEAFGRVRKAISIVKKRSSFHEDTIREFALGPGVIVGPPLRGFRGILTGVPVYQPEADAPDDGGPGDPGD
jgi:circadian clock protein KaiC